MRSVFQYSLIFIFILAFLISCSNRFETASARLEEIADEYDAVGLAVGVVKNNRMIYLKAFGLSDKENQKPLQTDMLFRIASISKSFTATAFMQLAEEGKVSLDDDFGRLIGFPVRNPRYPDKVITLRMILSHTSSLSDRNGYFTLDVINPGKNENRADCYNDYAPGEKYEYCNLNFNMAGAALEKITGNRFDKEIEKRILKPLGLNAGYNLHELDSSKLVKLYVFNPEKEEYEVQPSAYTYISGQAFENYEIGYSAPYFSPTGGMKISSEDLTRYMMMHMNYGTYNGVRLISGESSKLMQTPISDSGYGLALEKVSALIPGVTLTGHTGSAYGLFSNMFFEPEEKFGFVVITNGCRESYDSDKNLEFSKAIINYLYEYFIKEK